jgi:hypothetical protein
MDQFKEADNNPFDAPVPGQGLTDKPGNYPWEHPPQYTDTSEAADYVWDKLTQPQFAEQVIAMLDAGIPVEAIGRIIIFTGFAEGKWTPDVAFIITEPVMKMIAAVGIHGGVKKIRMSMQDLTNKKSLQSIVQIKENKKQFETIAKGIAKDITAEPRMTGLMAQPEQAEEIE